MGPDAPAASRCQPLPRRMSAFILDTNGPGLERENLTAKIGLPTCNTALFRLTDYAVPAENLLGQEGEPVAGRYDHQGGPDLVPIRMEDGVVLRARRRVPPGSGTRLSLVR